MEAWRLFGQDAGGGAICEGDCAAGAGRIGLKTACRLSVVSQFEIWPHAIIGDANRPTHIIDMHPVRIPPADHI